MKKGIDGKLYIIATPIGNLGDISIRAIDILKKVDIILAEKPSDSIKLLKHLGIRKKMYMCNQHSLNRDIMRYLNKIKEGKIAAYITSAGTPSISDPGSKLVDMAYTHNIKVIPIPGASSLTTAISISGFSLKPIIFYGYLSHKSNKRKKC
jgi:16S rRNA (cytidine1402-2'-O)-methyltransferase